MSEVLRNNRVTYRRRHSYATPSNKIRLARSPGGRLIVQYVTKRASGVHAPKALGHQRLQGIPRARSAEMKRLSGPKKTVSRAYGGVLTADQVKERILRAFLSEEHRQVKAFVRAQEKKRKRKIRSAAASAKKSVKPASGKKAGKDAKKAAGKDGKKKAKK